jgi:hypothetical protein
MFKKLVSGGSRLFYGVSPLLYCVVGSVATLYSQRINPAQFSWIDQQPPEMLKSVFFFYVLVIVFGLAISALSAYYRRGAA